MEKDIELQKELEKCAKCGQCRSVCPVFLALKDEKMVTRGRLSLIQAQQISNQIQKSDLKQLDRIIETCLMCQKCEEKCPSLVKTNDIFKTERKRIARQKGLPLMLKFGFRWILPYRWLYNEAIKFVYRLQRIFRRSNGTPGRHLAFLQRVPKLSGKSALDEHRSDNKDYRTAEVAIFIGCAANYIYPDIISNLTKILRRNNIKYFIPDKQLCCGFPTLLSGDEKAAGELVQRNLMAFVRANTILTVCPTCNKMLKESYKSRRSRLVEIHDAFDFLKGLPQSPIQESHSAIPAVFHKPCHLSDASAENIIDFLESSTSYRQIDDLCCGGGGLFSFKYPELSNQIGEARLQSLLTGNRVIHNPQPATTIVTSCPGCMMQLDYLLSANNIPDTKVKHIIEIMNDLLHIQN